jgi:hypothetical protein
MLNRLSSGATSTVKGARSLWLCTLTFLLLAEIAPAELPVRVTHGTPGRGEIQPGQYGQFIEYLCDLVPGMWSEKLYDGSFDEPERVTPSRSTLRIHSGQFIYHFPRLSLTVLRIRVR